MEGKAIAESLLKHFGFVKCGVAKGSGVKKKAKKAYARRKEMEKAVEAVQRETKEASKGKCEGGKAMEINIEAWFSVLKANKAKARKKCKENSLFNLRSKELLGM